MTSQIKGRIRAKDIDGEYEFGYVYKFYDSELNDWYFETSDNFAYTIHEEDILQWIPLISS